MIVHAIILARGGSKAVPKKNVIDFCGKPLIAWTIEQCLLAEHVTKVWVSSDSEEILSISKDYGANLIPRPDNISDDKASSESGWLHAIDYVQEREGLIDLVLAPQVTSPIREPKDIDNGIKKFIKGSYDSMFAASYADDMVLWKRKEDNILECINYDYPNMQRHDVEAAIIDTGSFYLFTPKLIQKNQSRLGGNIGLIEIEFWKMFEIDNYEDLRLCSSVMKEYLLKDQSL